MRNDVRVRRKGSDSDRDKASGSHRFTPYVSHLTKKQ